MMYARAKGVSVVLRTVLLFAGTNLGRKGRRVGRAWPRASLSILSISSRASLFVRGGHGRESLRRVAGARFGAEFVVFGAGT